MGAGQHWVLYETGFMGAYWECDPIVVDWYQSELVAWDRRSLRFFWGFRKQQVSEWIRGLDLQKPTRSLMP